MRLPLALNDLIQVAVDAFGARTFCDSNVREISAGTLLISWPEVSGERLPIRENQVLTISFSHNRRAYEFDAEVVGLIDDPVALLNLRTTSSLRSTQRRDDVRIHALAPVELTAKVVGLARYKDARTRPHRIKGETADISAGGFSLLSSTPFAVGTAFEVRLTLPGESRTPLEMSARIVRCRLVDDSGDHPGEPAARFDLALSFTRISEGARASIVRFVFGAQRETRTDE